MTQVNTEMANYPLEEKNCEELHQIQLYMTQLCHRNISTSRKSSLQWKERKAGKEAGENKQLVVFLLEAADLSRCRNTGLFLSLLSSAEAMV